MDKSLYAQIEKADIPREQGPQPAPPQRPQQTLRRKVSRAFSSWTSRSGEKSKESPSDALPAPTPALPPPSAARRVSSTQELRRVPVPHTPTYPLVRMDPVLIGCFVCL
ncbi:hypothetical protein BV20DRAFT_975159 [Pilatotrama ljubarskyi]|nr:hypothetical protein BV20DRAFT_975159 [Pilatotrama ljubarskyi]